MRIMFTKWKERFTKRRRVNKEKKAEKVQKEHSQQFLKTMAFLNKFSLVFHMVIAFAVVFVVELVSRRSFGSAVEFLDQHSWAFLYNMFLVFCSLILVYLVRRRTFLRVIISGFWLFLGIVNGCVLSNRVTPFGYTDLKCLPELFAMSNTNYFTTEQTTMVIVGVSSFFALCLFLFLKGPKFRGELHFVAVPIAFVATLFIGIPITTQAAQSSNVLTGYFANIAQGYENYGFIYGFSCSVVDRGMDKPKDYSEETIDHIMKKVNKKKSETDYVPAGEKKSSKGKQDSRPKKNNKKKNKEKQPNVICVLLESFCDPEEIRFLKTNKDPIPTFHKLEKKYSTGYLTVPVVGAGTANTEFEILTGMSMQHFGTGEYPYKTILKETDCESVASDLSSLGYGTHVVHNNGGNFYSRVNAFSMMGFDDFTSKEMMDITEYTPSGSWPEDFIMVDETMKALDSTPDQADFTYIITVGSHGDYPKEKVIMDPPYRVKEMEDEGVTNQWTYYINQLNEVDRFMNQLIEAVEKRKEDTVIVFFGDHLPTMGLEDKDMKSNDIYKTKYVTWNNMGLQKKDVDLTAYQLLASITDSVGIHEGTIMNYHQTQMNQKKKKAYKEGLKQLQYDILYGKRYCYDGEDAYPASDLIMGTQEVVIDTVCDAQDRDKVLITGENFTRWSRVFVNGERVPTKYFTGRLLAINKEDLKDGDTVVVNQLGSEDTVFRSSNEVVYEEPELYQMPEATPEATVTAE